MIRVILQAVVLTILLLYISASYLFATNEVKEITCTDFKVEIADSGKYCLISSVEVERLISRAALIPVGKSYSAIDTDAIESKVKEFRQVRRVVCYKTAEGVVRLRIDQRIPILRVIDARGGQYYIDREGKDMPISSFSSAYVPVATGNITSEFARNELFLFAQYLEKHPFWNAQVMQIDVSKTEVVSLVPRVGTHTILIGRVENLDQKFANLRLLYDKGFDRIGWNSYKIIDLRFKNQIICTK